MEKRRWWIETALYGTGAGRRFTQDGPVLPDVWLGYLEDPAGRRDLLIEPWLETPLVVQALSRMPKATRVTYNRTMVVASLTLKELIERVLPMAGWYRWVWRDHVPNGTRATAAASPTPAARP